MSQATVFLGSLLEPLRAVSSETSILPKYQYPSAGSLYAVQTYASFDSKTDNWKYYNVDSHRLVDCVKIGGGKPFVNLSSVLKQVEAVLVFVGNTSAIEKAYPVELAKDFCLLETGRDL